MVNDKAARFGSAIVIGGGGAIGQAVMAELFSTGLVEHVFALGRHPDRLAGPQRTALMLDYCQPDSFSAAAAAISDSARPVGLLLIATGVLHGPGFSPEKSLRQLDARVMGQVMHINAIGPIMAIQAFAPLITKRQHGVVAALSARVGSISDNRLGGWYAYRASKAALNMLLKTASIELNRRDPTLSCIGLHPGTVDTDLSTPYQANVAAGKLFSPQQSATYLCKVLTSVTPAQSGQVLAWNNIPISA